MVELSVIAVIAVMLPSTGETGSLPAWAQDAAIYVGVAWLFYKTLRDVVREKSTDRATREAKAKADTADQKAERASQIATDSRVRAKNNHKHIRQQAIKQSRLVENLSNALHQTTQQLASATAQIATLTESSQRDRQRFEDKIDTLSASHAAAERSAAEFKSMYLDMQQKYAAEQAKNVDIMRRLDDLTRQNQEQAKTMLAQTAEIDRLNEATDVKRCVQCFADLETVQNENASLKKRLLVYEPCDPEPPASAVGHA